MECGNVPEDLDAYFDNVIEKYFSRENYWRIDGGLYYSIYELDKYIKAAGSVEALAESFRRFREKTRAAGLGEINLVGIEWGLQNEKLNEEPNGIAKKLGLNAITSYIWAHNRLPAWPHGTYHESSPADGTVGRRSAECQRLRRFQHYSGRHNPLDWC